MPLTLEHLTRAVAQEAAIRRVRRLQPAGGPGDKIFPPTYPGERNDPPRHVFELRRIGGQELRCVLLDSVQSQANRLEEALLGAMRAGRITLPLIAVDFRECAAHGQRLGDIGVITSLDAPHRVFDAILRDADCAGEPFMRSAAGLRLQTANLRNATALFELSPTALLFGAWNSTGEGGGLGAKFPRCIVSEIVGVDAVEGKRTGSRIDPLGIVREVPIYQLQDNDRDWTPFDQYAAKAKNGEPILFKRKQGDKPGRPSIINHGNVTPSVSDLGVTVDHVRHTAVITLAGLRRLSLPDRDGRTTAARDDAARAVLAALGLVALVEQDLAGYALRSRCDLVPEGPVPFELVQADGGVATFELDADAAADLLAQAVRQAEGHGLPWRAEPVRLAPQARLVELVALSRDKALRGEADGAEDA
jgi:CRISPR-associated protein Csb1